MTRFRGALLALCALLLLTAGLPAARLTLFIDGDVRTPYDAARGTKGRAEWTTAVTARAGTILTDDFQETTIDVPAGTTTRVGHFGVFFTQTGGYSGQAGNTAPRPHPTGVFVGTTGTGSTTGGNDETIQGLELRFDPPVFAWAADVFSVDGRGFGQGGGPDSNDHTTLHVLGHAFDFTEVFTYAGSGYNGFFGIVSDVPFSAIGFTAGGDGDRWRLDNVSIAR